MFVRRTLAALAIGAVVAGQPATAASAAGGEGTTNAADAALQIRSEALNTRYAGAGTRLAPDELDALVARSEGLNGYGESLQAAAPVASVSASPSFAWDDFGIGMAAAFGLVLLAGGLVLAVRTGSRKQAGIPS